MKKALPLLLTLCLLLSVTATAAEEETVPFVPFETVTLDGAPVTSELYAQADYTIVMYWATWCSACHASVPDLVAAMETLNEKKENTVQAVGVLTDAVNPETLEREEDVIAKGAALAESLNISYPVVVPDVNLFAVMRIVQYLPTFFVVNREGNVVYATYGAQEEAEWLRVFDQLTKTP